MSGLRASTEPTAISRIVEAAPELFREAAMKAPRSRRSPPGRSVGRHDLQLLSQQGRYSGRHRRDGSERSPERRARRHRQPPRDVDEAVDALIGIYIEHSLVYLSKEMWRQAMAISTQQPDSPFGKTYTALDRALTDQTLRADRQAAGVWGWYAATLTGAPWAR